MMLLAHLELLVQSYKLQIYITILRQNLVYFILELSWKFSKKETFKQSLATKTTSVAFLKDAFFFLQNLFPNVTVGNANTERSVALILTYFCFSETQLFLEISKKVISE